MMTKLVSWLVVLLIVVWAISDPAVAGTSVHHWVTGLIAFFTHVAKG